jgi:hypothetical protein
LPKNGQENGAAPNQAAQAPVVDGLLVFDLQKIMQRCRINDGDDPEKQKERRDK